MKRNLLFLAIVILYIFTFACSSNNDVTEEPIDKENDNKEFVYNAVYVAKDNKMAFVAINKNGEIFYCLDKYSMGYGKIKFANNQLIISNEYTGHTDEIEISNTKNDEIKLKGYIRQCNSTDFSYIDLTLNKSNEQIISSWKREEWVHEGMHNINGDANVYYVFETEHTGKWETRLQSTGTLVSGKTFHYVPRTLIDTDANGNVRIRKIAYYHNDNDKNPEIHTVGEEYYNDIAFY